MGNVGWQLELSLDLVAMCISIRSVCPMSLSLFDTLDSNSNLCKAGFFFFHMDASHSVCHNKSRIFLKNRINFGA